MGEIESEFLFEITAQLGDRREFGATPRGWRRFVKVIGGEFAGPRLRGEVLPDGGDWAVVESDGLGWLDVRLSLRADDGALIYLAYTGLLDVAEDLRRAFGREAIDPRRYYFRTQATFEVADPRYTWLRRRLAVGTGRIHQGLVAVTYRLHAIL